MERLKFELDTIKNMGFPGYFLIVQDFINAAREMGVAVGPGRGSAAGGSAVAYCLQITDIDPLKYDLLFERFLNPDRISMPDIDIDFDDEGRGKVLRWVTENMVMRGLRTLLHMGQWPQNPQYVMWRGYTNYRFRNRTGWQSWCRTGSRT